MLDAVMLVVAYIYQAIITTPAVTMHHTFRIYFAAYNALKRLFSGIRDDPSVYLSLAFKEAKDNGLALSPATTLAGDASRAKVGLIYFNGAGHRSLPLAPLGYLTRQSPENNCYRTTTQTSQFSAVGGRKFNGKISNQLPKFGLRKF